MESAELAKLVFSRVQKVYPDNVSKIVGCILLREPDEDEMVQLAYGPEATLLATIVDAKATLAIIYARCSSMHYAAGATAGYQQYCSHPAAAGLRHFSPSLSFHVPSPYWPDPSPASTTGDHKTQQECTTFMDAAAATDNHYPLRGGQHQNGLDDHLDAAMGNNYYYTASTEDAFHNGVVGSRTTTGGGRRSNGISSRRPCHYFFKGICKNGQNCHYSHHQLYSDGFAMDHHLQGGGGGGAGTTPGSLERLELEITELLHSRRGQPVSIASLPTLYGEKYGKGLQADGYLTESQRHGKAGYSLTKLLSRLNKIRVIERPHGQHSVVLAEDAAKYTDCRSDRGGGDMPASSHQIYLTFPSDSTFTEDDVATYFSQYGPVRDVRIPCQDQRMFGFVSFQNPETVTSLLMRRNPHFICGSRVLAKPYREKSKCINERTKPMMQCYPPRWFDSTDPEFYSDQYDSPRLARKQLAEKRERLFELERRRLAGLRTEPLLPQFAYFDCSIGDVGPFSSQQSAGSKEVGLTMDPLVTPDPLDIVSTSQAPDTHTSNNYDNQESDQIELLPENPFAASVPTENSL